MHYESGVPSAAQAAFNTVIGAYESMFSNPITITLDVQFGSTGLASSSTAVGTAAYATWRAEMIAASEADPDNAYLAAAAASLSASNPLGNGSVLLTYANALALGFGVPPVTYDSTLTFSNTANFEYTGVAAPGAYDFMNVAEHELNEALGITSTLTGIANGGALPSAFAALDYFRYSSSGVRLVSTNPNDQVYFSYNGATDVAQFNQDNNAAGNAGADRNDWIYGNFGCPASSPGPYIQDAIGCPNSAIAFGPDSPESIVLQSLGYDLAAPEPASIGLLSGGVATLGLLRRKHLRVTHQSSR